MKFEFLGFLVWPKDSLVLGVSFWGLNIALSPNLIGSSDADFHKDSESGLNSKITFSTYFTNSQNTAELAAVGDAKWGTDPKGQL